MNVGAPRPLSHGAQVLLEDAQQLAGLLVQRAHGAAMALDGLAPGAGWQAQQIGPGTLAWVQPAPPIQPPPMQAEPPAP